MQSDYKEIYRLTSEKTGVDQQIYKDLGNYVFSALYSHLRKPQSLITKLRGIGSWYLRRQRMKIAVEREMTILKTLEERDTILPLLSERLKDYEQYVELKKEVRLKRNETQTILGSKEEGTLPS